MSRKLRISTIILGFTLFMVITFFLAGIYETVFYTEDEIISSKVHDFKNGEMLSGLKEVFIEAYIKLPKAIFR